MPAYLIADIDVTNPEGYRAYAEQVGAAIAAHGGRYLARAGATEVLEGDWQPNRLVLLEFPSLDAARAFYTSAEYERIKPFRLEHSSGRLVLTNGVSP